VKSTNTVMLTVMVLSMLVKSTPVSSCVKMNGEPKTVQTTVMLIVNVHSKSKNVTELGLAEILKISPLKSWLTMIPMLMVPSTQKMILKPITMLSSLNIVISTMMELLMLVKSTTVLSSVKMNGEPNTAQIMDMPIATVHSTFQFVKELGTVLTSS
jgi:hypothetical protein